MSGSGSRDGFGAPPWGPADPVPKLDDTLAIPGLGPAPGPEQDAPQQGSWRQGSWEQPGNWEQQGNGHQRGSVGAAGQRAPAARLEQGSRRQRKPARTGLGKPGHGDPRRRRPSPPAKAPPQLLARAPGARRRRAGARARHQVLRDPGLLHPVLLDGEHPGNQRPGADQQDRLPPAADPPRRHHRVRRHRVLELEHTRRGAPTSSARRSSELEGIVGISHDSVHLHQARDRPARRPREPAATTSARSPSTASPLHESDYLYPLQPAVRPDLRHHGPARPPVGDG